MPSSLCSATKEATALRSPHTATREWPPCEETREEPTQRQGPSADKNKIRRERDLEKCSVRWEAYQIKMKAQWWGGGWGWGTSLHGRRGQVLTSCQKEERLRLCSYPTHLSHFLIVDSCTHLSFNSRTI